MLLKSNLNLLRAQLLELAETPYFSPGLDEFIRELVAVLDALLKRLDESPPVSDELARHLGDGIWELTRFLTGSTTKEIPYEMVYAIERAALEWQAGPLIITTAIVHSADFFFQTGLEDFQATARSELGVTVTNQPVQIALPYVYRHKPLFCIPLFHELGHHVDIANTVVDISLLSHPDNVGPDLPDVLSSAKIGELEGHERRYWSLVVESHRREYFADLFSAAYVGHAASEFLVQFCGNEPMKLTHPSTQARRDVIRAFLDGHPNPIVDMLQDALKIRGMRPLTKRFSAAGVDHCFGGVRPCTPKSDEEIYGVFLEAWDFLNRMWTSPVRDYLHLTPFAIERVVNDLTEKSIRNYMVTSDWHAAADAH